MNIKNLSLIAFLSLFLFGIGSMDAQSVAHVNSNTILEAMPSYKEAQTKLEGEAARHKAEVERRQTEMQTILTDAQAQMETVKDKPEAEQRAMMQKLAPVQEDLQKKQQELMEYQQTAADSLNKMEAEMVKPIYDKVQAAIQVVGDTQKIGYIIDMSVAGPNGNVLYYQGGKDVTQAVIQQLNK